MPEPYAIYCADPLDPKAVDPAFLLEADAARKAGFHIVRLDHDALDRVVDVSAALRIARFGGEGPAIYRGWMMRAEAYTALFDGLRQRGITLRTTPAAYEACHHAPGSYAALADWMPKTAWLSKASIDDAAAIPNLLSVFGSGPVVLKDWVKSQAGYWREACFIPDASSTADVSRVVARFRELQGDSLVGGLVFKAYVPLEPVGAPAFEYRAFIVEGRVVGCWARSEEATAVGMPPLSLLNDVAAHVPSSFASADFGRDSEGRWWLLEVGDGQVSGLPTEEAGPAIFAALAS